MGIRLYAAQTPGLRHCATPDFKEITLQKRSRPLSGKLTRQYGRNNRGVITSRHRGGGHKRVYRYVDNKRVIRGIPATVIGVAYDPNRGARLALVQYPNGEQSYILHAYGVVPGQTISAGPSAPVEPGNSMPLKAIPLGLEIHNIEIQPGRGGQLARAAGAYARLVAKEGDYATLRLPSGETRLIRQECWATIGRVGNIDRSNQRAGKAGRTRWLGRRPHVRGSVMNPCDHPHGGGEGRAPVGRSHPVTPWGRIALGQRTRRPNKYSDKLVLRGRR
uniref:Large ribosomal subunit protein uL2c n=1 Tax=Chloroparvula japonica TaxID=1411623 RepID=A0A4D6C431_9CHLO|nr:ribosomal protein L2 [Chloroparvula japonica]QBX98137.1 ribosomal protein L2 [Chloroparvula japonica]